MELRRASCVVPTAETLIFKIEVPPFYHHLAYGHIRTYSLSIQIIFLRDINVEIEGKLLKTFDFFLREGCSRNFVPAYVDTGFESDICTCLFAQ